MNTPFAQTGPSNLFDRVFGLEKHEYAAVAWSFVYFFCVLSSYYMLRPIRESMAVGSGPNTIPFLFLGTFVVMICVTPVFGWVASKYPRRRFLPWVYLFFIVNILIFWAVFTIAIDNKQDHVWLGRGFFVWLSVFNLFVVSVFWSFMADIYTREQGRRLFGVIAAGGSFGALLGGAATSFLVVEIGRVNLFPIAASLLAISVFCIRRLRHWVDVEKEQLGAEIKAKPLGGNPFSGITHTLSSPYFSGIAFSSVIASLLGTALYMFTATLVGQEIPDPDRQTQFFSNVNNVQNILALLVQLFGVRLLVKRFNIGVSLALVPAMSIIGFAIVALDPTLIGITVLTIIRRGLGFGFTKPTTDMLYSVVTPEEKYKTKNFIDTAIYRGGDVVGIWSIAGMTSVLGMGMAAVCWVMAPFAAIWAAVALWLGRDYKRRAKLGIGSVES